MRATDGKLQTLLLRANGTRWPVSMLLVASIFFAIVLGLFLFVRRATGALTAPLPVPQLIATAVIACLWALVVQELTAKRQIFFWISLGVLLLVAIGCSFPTSRFVDWLVWLPAIGLVAAFPFATRIKRWQPGRRPLPASYDHAIADQVLQQLTRVRTAEGKDALRGTLVAEFALGERQVTLYVGFCPPFELLPEVELNVADDSEADVKLSQVLHNGAQLDVRLSEPAEEAIAVSIEFFAIEGESVDQPF